MWVSCWSLWQQHRRFLVSFRPIFAFERCGDPEETKDPDNRVGIKNQNEKNKNINTPHTQHIMMERTADYCIIGAGLAGLRLADRLTHQCPSLSILVIEANNRIGGRIKSQPIHDDSQQHHVVDGGAQFIGGTHTKMLKLVKELEIEKFNASRNGKFRWAQEIGPWFRFGLSPDVSEPRSFDHIRSETEALAATVPLTAPWNAPNAAELDSQTFGQWLRKKKFPKSACVPYERLCKMHLGCDPEQVSLLYMLFLLHSCGGYNQIVKEGGAHQWRIKGGSWKICQRLAERVGSENILLGSAVTKIVHNETRVEIICRERLCISAGRVIITLQPQLCQNICFEPPLSDDRNALHQHYLTKRPFTAKTHFIHDRPFWRDHGYSGTGVTSSGVVFVDNSPPDSDNIGILLAFRDTRRRDLTHDKLQRYAKTLFGSQAGHPKQVIEQDWSTEEYTASCISHTPPGLLSKHGKALREPIGRIHWAGAETSPYWPSFMEGAVHSADRVLEEIAR